jgi:hypothetical protein
MFPMSSYVHLCGRPQLIRQLRQKCDRLVWTADQARGVREVGVAREVVQDRNAPAAGFMGQGRTIGSDSARFFEKNVRKKKKKNVRSVGEVGGAREVVMRVRFM